MTTETQPETEAIQPPSPVSSVLLSESTKELIHSLSTQQIAPSLNAEGVIPETTNTALPKPKQTDKKPIKFTVRKVSRDTVNVDRGRKNYLYGNLAENRNKPNSLQLQHTQARFDMYETKIDKIDKEIAFLTNLLPPFNVEIDYATRNKITHAIEKLRTKKDEVEKKRYHLGITLSRLWREHDNNEIFVRSVSNQ